MKNFLYQQISNKRSLVVNLCCGLAMISAIILITCVANTDSLLLSPLISAEEFLASMPHVVMQIGSWEFILIQPTSTAFVYFQGFFMIILGIILLCKKGYSRSRIYWAIGIALWGLGAVLAGTSYQAFGYELRVKGNEFALFTSNWEIAYLLVTAYSINYFLAGTAYACTTGAVRNGLVIYSIIHSIIYTIILLIGVLIPNEFMISYFAFIAFVAINFILMFIINVYHYVKHKDKFSMSMIIIWLSFLALNIMYFIFFFAGIGPLLYENYGVWFNENDVLHILLIVWAILTFVSINKFAKDKPFQEIKIENAPTQIDSEH